MENTIVVVLGASGDLARKKSFPALFGLFSAGLFSSSVKIVGYARTKMDDAEFKRRITASIKGQDREEVKQQVNKFKEICSYISGGYEDDESFQGLNSHLETIEKNHSSTDASRLFHLAIPQAVYVPASKYLRQNCYSSKGYNRILVGGPFGRDLQSCDQLLTAVGQHWAEEETFRIDHYLGKELVKSIIALRFSNNAIVDWNKNTISNVQITFKEPYGTEGRGGYFDKFGIIRDVIQNHLLQILSVIAMERPDSLSNDDIRNEKAKVLRAIPPVMLHEMLLGQYVSANGKPGYLDDDTVPSNSSCPTFAAVPMFIHNSRWEGVPFILVAGKAVDEAKVEVRIQFKDVPQDIFKNLTRNELVLHIQPSEAFYLKFNIKTPGLHNEALSTELDVTYKQRFPETKIPEVYEVLILDALKGDHSSFVRADELIGAWKIFAEILRFLDSEHSPKPAPYAYGSKGPVELDSFIANYGYESTG